MEKIQNAETTHFHCGKLEGEKSYKNALWGFPGGAVVGSLPANAGDAGSSPGLGRSHMPWSNWARAPQLLSLRSRACKPQLLRPACLEPMLRSRRGHRDEEPTHRGEEWPLLAASGESPHAATKTQHSQKKKTSK